MKAGWRVVPLGELAEVKPPKREARARLKSDQQVSFVPMEDLKQLQRTFAPQQVRSLSAVYGGYTYFAENDVLLAKITPCFENGKLSIARGLQNGIGFGSSEFMVLRCSAKLDPDYLFYFLSRDMFRETGKGRMTGAVGHKRVPPEFVQSQEIPLPPLDEQKRIVAVLDEAFEGLSRARANAEANFADARALFGSTLASAFGAKNWPTKYLHDISENLDRFRVPITKGDRVSGDVPYYGASGVVDYVEGFLFEEDLLLISEDGANLLARTYPIAFSISGKSWVNNHAHVLRFPDFETQEFVRLYLNSISLEPYVSGMAQPKLNQAQLNRIPIPFPSALERSDLVSKAQAIATETAALEQQFSLEIKSLDTLHQALLQKAFSGELT